MRKGDLVNAVYWNFDMITCPTLLKKLTSCKVMGTPLSLTNNWLNDMKLEYGYREQC